MKLPIADEAVCPVPLEQRQRMPRWFVPVSELGIWRLGPARASLLALRLGMGWFMFYAGWTKVYSVEGWSAARFLTYATSGPFVGLFHAMAGNVFIDLSVMAGEIAIGLALLLGIAIRFSAVSGIALFLPLYLAHLPPVDGWVSSHVVYMLALAALAGARAGTVYGIDGLLEDWERRIPMLRYVLG